MPPGRNAPPRKSKASEAPQTEYEKVRAQLMMRNNQVLQRLGVNTLASIVNNTTSKSKGKGRDCEGSGSLYEGDSDDSEQGEVTKVAKGVSRKCSKHSVYCSATSLRASKRVVALDQLDEPTRVTKQKTRELTFTTGPDVQEVPSSDQISITTTHDALLSSGLLIEEQDQENIRNEVRRPLLQAELEIERQEKSELRQQLDDLKMQALQSEEARAKQADEIEVLKKSSQENNSLLHQLLQFNTSQCNPNA